MNIFVRLYQNLLARGTENRFPLGDLAPSSIPCSEGTAVRRTNRAEGSRKYAASRRLGVENQRGIDISEAVYFRLVAWACNQVISALLGDAKLLILKLVNIGAVRGSTQR